MEFKRGQKVVYEGKVYDFGYRAGENGERAVIYEEGECNMQDSISVPLKSLRLKLSLTRKHAQVLVDGAETAGVENCRPIQLLERALEDGDEIDVDLHPADINRILEAVSGARMWNAHGASVLNEAIGILLENRQ